MSQLRQHLKFTLMNKLRAYFQRQRLGFLGEGVHISNNVKLMRFPKNISVGTEVVIKEGARICSCNPSAKIQIGERTTVGYHTFIFASDSIIIGSDCLIAPFVYLVDSNHQIRRDNLINAQPNEKEAIVVGNGVWLASGVTILKGVTIGEGAVVAANSLVNKDIPPFEIWGGTPAKKIGERE